MARPRKQGLEYFPLDSDFLSERKLNAPRRAFGSLAVVIYLQLLCILYRDKGYYIDFSAETREDVIMDLLTVLIGQDQPSFDKVAEVVDALVTSRLFHQGLYAQGVLTSKRAQQVYYRATVERRLVHVDPDIWLLEPEEMRELSTKHSLLLQQEEPPENGVSRPNNPQSIVQHSKEQHITAHNSTADETASETEDTGRLYRKFQTLFGRPPQAGFCEEALAQGRPAEVVLECMAVTARKDARRPEPYILTVLKGFPASAPPPPEGGLEPWEQLWLQEREARKLRRKKSAGMSE